MYQDTYSDPDMEIDTGTDLIKRLHSWGFSLLRNEKDNELDQGKKKERSP